MDTLVQSVSTYSGIGIFDLSGTVGPAGSSDTFAMYLFTNGAEKIFGVRRRSTRLWDFTKAPAKAYWGLI